MRPSPIRAAMARWGETGRQATGLPHDARRNRASAMAQDKAESPLSLFDTWFAEARAGEPSDPEAMVLATAGADGRISCRMAR